MKKRQKKGQRIDERIKESYYLLESVLKTT